jgi:hypothetical protein
MVISINISTKVERIEKNVERMTSQTIYKIKNGVTNVRLPTNSRDKKRMGIQISIPTNFFANKANNQFTFGEQKNTNTKSIINHRLFSDRLAIGIYSCKKPNLNHLGENPVDNIEG